MSVFNSRIENIEKKIDQLHQNQAQIYQELMNKIDLISNNEKEKQNEQHNNNSNNVNVDNKNENVRKGILLQGFLCNVFLCHKTPPLSVVDNYIKV